jgi:hypothetical protein
VATANSYGTRREEVPMDPTVDVTIPVDARRPANYAMRGSDQPPRRPRTATPATGSVEKLFTAIEELGADAEAKGPTDESWARNWPPTTASAGADCL